MFRIAVDIGGTFTDGIINDPATGEVWLAKTLSTPDDPGRAVSQIIESLLEKVAMRGGPADVADIVHGSTIVTNALIERKGARTALFTTQGMADIIDIGRELRYDLYDLSLERPEPLVPGQLRFEVAERIAADGAALRAPDLAEVEKMAQSLPRMGVQSVAVSFLNASVHDAHEKAVAEVVSRVCPDLPVSISSGVAREIREYERTTTAVANAYVRPLVQDYLRGLGARVVKAQVEAPLRIMVSSGGFVSADVAAEVPIALLESGPAGGVISAAVTGAGVGHQNLLAFDMGGTTAKLCVLIDGNIPLTHLFETARVRRFKKGSGLPIQSPSIDLIEIGAGGGSIAHANALGLLNVGPASAGSQPGPACYGIGGVQPTVTDANLVLGYLNADNFLGGEMKLDVALARTALERLGRDLGLSGERVAQGISEVVNENMAAAARVHIAERGMDPRTFSMVATGGGGPVHAVDVARRLGIRTVILPVGVGVGSCLGFLAAPPRVDRSWSRPALLASAAWAEVGREVRSMKADASADLAAAGCAEGEVNWTIGAEIRFRGQGASLLVEAPFEEPSEALGSALQEQFFQKYSQLYGNIVPRAPLEVVTWRISGVGGEVSARFSWPDSGENSSDPIAHRKIFLPASGAFQEVPVYSRYGLPAGVELSGPLIVEERESTLVVNVPARVTVAVNKSLIVEMLELEHV